LKIKIKWLSKIQLISILDYSKSIKKHKN